MNIIDLFVLLVMALFVLSGYYRGFLWSIFSIASYILCALLALGLMFPVSGIIKNDEEIYNTMLFYTEGAEFINDPELARTEISQVSGESLQSIIASSDLPMPLGSVISKNVAKEVYDEDGVTLLGDYFNLTIVNFILKVIVFLVLFVILRIIASLALGSYDSASRLPSLIKGDRLIGMGVGFIRGLLALFMIYMLIPIVLTIFNLTFVHNLFDGSFFSSIFYKGNFLLKLL